MSSPWSKNCNKTVGEGLAPPAVEGGYHLPFIKQAQDVRRNVLRCFYVPKIILLYIYDRGFFEGGYDPSDPYIGNTQTEAVFQDKCVFHDQCEYHQRDGEDHHCGAGEQFSYPVM